MLIIIFIQYFIRMLNRYATKWHNVCILIGYNSEIQTWRIPYELICEK